MNFRNMFEKISNKLYQKDLKDLDENSVGIIEERNRMGKKLIGSLIVAGGIAAAGITGSLIYNAWKNRDSDGDGIPDEVEKKYGTDPFKKDTDDDGTSDYEEIFVYGTNPLKSDTDDDGVDDYKEVFMYKTNPLKADSDEDGIPDGGEVFKYGTNPLKKDTDSDGVDDHEEILVYKTHPLKADTDGDGISDGDEVFRHRTDPLKADTDNDEIDDYKEIFLYGTNPLKADSDSDWINDYEEIFVYKTDPLKADTDDDGISDYKEIFVYKTNPLKKDSDDDGISDVEEVFKYNTNPLKTNPNVKYAIDKGLEEYLFLVKPLDEDGVQDRNEREFVELLLENRKILVIPTFINYLKEKASDGLITDEELKYSNNFSQLVNGLYDVVKEARIVDDPIKTTDYSSNLGLRLGFDKELAKNATIKAIGYYGIAIVDRKLPENFDEISLLARGTQIDGYGDKLVDFSPIIFYSVDGNHYVLVPDVGRETWMLCLLYTSDAADE